MTTNERLLPTIAAVVGPERLLILNPFHAEGISPDLACMFDTEARIHQLAGACIEQRPGDAQPFWCNRARTCSRRWRWCLRRKHPGVDVSRPHRGRVEPGAATARAPAVGADQVAYRHLPRGRGDREEHFGQHPGARAGLSAGSRRVACHPPDAQPQDLCHGAWRGAGAPAVRREASGVARDAEIFFELLLQYALDLDDSEERRLFFFLDEVQEWAN